MKHSFESVFSVYDNTSASRVKIIGYKKGRMSSVRLGSALLVTPKAFLSSKDIQKKKKYIGLVVGLKRVVKRLNAVSISSLDNKMLLFSPQYKFLGSRVYGGVCKELKNTAEEVLYKRAITYASGIF